MIGWGKGRPCAPVTLEPGADAGRRARGAVQAHESCNGAVTAGRATRTLNKPLVKHKAGTTAPSGDSSEEVPSVACPSLSSTTFGKEVRHLPKSKNRPKTQDPHGCLLPELQNTCPSELRQIGSVDGKPCRLHRSACGLVSVVCGRFKNQCLFGFTFKLLGEL